MAMLTKSRDGVRPGSGWVARHHLRRRQTWRGHGEDLQRGEPPDTGMRDVRGLVWRRLKQTTAIEKSSVARRASSAT